MSDKTGDNSFCIIMPAFHEAAHIADVVRRVKQVCPDVIVVDDGSGDATAAEAESAGATVLKHAVNQGKGAAIITGCRHALEQGYELAVVMDADGQHDPGDIPAFLDAYRATGDKVIIGNRMGGAAAMPFVRRMTNRFMSWLLSRRMQQKVPDTQSGFRLYARDVLGMLDVESKRFAAESEVLLNLAEQGIRIGSVPIRVIYGDERSKINPVRDTFRFFGMLRRHKRGRAARRRSGTGGGA